MTSHKEVPGFAVPRPKQRRGDIQGIRAIAVIAVVLFHAFPAYLPGGFIGVDVFFVISGYLITHIVYRDTMESRFSLGNFYRNRIRRIFPALFAMIFITVCVNWFILAPTGSVSLANSAIAALFSVSNIYFWKTSGYFAPASVFQPLLHTWSLGVEEQFYIFLPLSIFVLVRFARTYVIAVLAVAFTLSLFLSQITLAISSSASYFLLPTRSFELLAGSLLAVSGFRLSSSAALVRNGFGAFGLALILIPALIFTSDTPFPGINALYPTIGATLLLLVGSDGKSAVVSQSLSIRPLTFIGDLSYSIYLWHWPILTALRVLYAADLRFEYAIAAIAVALIMGYLSYRFIEQPFIHRRTSNLAFWRLSLAGMAGFAIVVSFILYTKGAPGRFPVESLKLFATAEDYNPQRSGCHNDNRLPKPYASNCVFGNQSDRQLVAIWGDSHGAELAYYLGTQSDQIGMNVMQITGSSCPPALHFKPLQRRYCIAFNDTMLTGVIHDGRIKLVILTMNSAAYVHDQSGLFGGLEEAIQALLQAGKKVAIVTQIPTFGSDPPTTLGYASFRHDDLSKLGKTIQAYEKDTSNWNAELRWLSNKYTVTLISAEDALCSNGFCPMYQKDLGGLYFNSDHVSLTGASPHESPHFY